MSMISRGYGWAVETLSSRKRNSRFHKRNFRFVWADSEKISFACETPYRPLSAAANGVTLSLWTSGAAAPRYASAP